MRVQTDLKSGRGLGDAIADFTHLTGLDRLTQAYERITGKDCGCEERREVLNKLVPFDNNQV
jgi:hypothetical protein